jgi:hypothetical protein
MPGSFERGAGLCGIRIRSGQLRVDFVDGLAERTPNADLAEQTRSHVLEIATDANRVSRSLIDLDLRRIRKLLRASMDPEPSSDRQLHDCRTFDDDAGETPGSECAGVDIDPVRP